jgi:predicted DNA-binding protein with PD1-like motif
MLLITVQPGEEVIESISRQLAEHGVTDGAIASLIGAVDACGISNMAETDHRNDIITELKQPLEFSGTGEIKAGKLHVHCVVSGEGNAALGGHLHWARVENFFVNAYVVPS